jgi:Uma2 family endonuclease
LPGRKVPRDPIAELAPDLAVDVISKYNTPREMERKLADYFAAGVRQVWYVHHAPRREVWVHVAPESPTVLGEGESLQGGDLLPGFRLELKELFAEPEQGRAS